MLQQILEQAEITASVHELEKIATESSQEALSSSATERSVHQLISN